MSRKKCRRDVAGRLQKAKAFICARRGAGLISLSIIVVAVSMSISAGTALVRKYSRIARDEEVTKHCHQEWHQDYVEMHNLYRKHGNGKALIAVGNPHGGLSDALAGAITLFYVALLTNRSFFLDLGPKSDYRWSFEYQHINWTHDRGHYYSTKKSSLEYLLDYSFRTSPKGISLIKAIRNGTLKYFEEDQNIVAISSNTGMISHMFENTLLKDRLYKLGLCPLTAFGCAFNFLFRNNNAVMNKVSFIMHHLQNKRVIGIHIRTGDGYLFDQSLSPRLKDFNNFFSCAMQIESSFMKASEQVVWLLVSDSIQLKQAAMRAYPHKVVTLQGSLLHSTLYPEDTSEETAKDALVVAAADMHLLSLSDYHVITLKSGFGRLSVALSFREKTSFSLLPNQHRNCSQFPDEFSYLASLSPGI
jgi:hypothetical protein